jgi:NADH-quinone oxidoreductase subunit G
MGNFLDLNGFEHITLDDVMEEISTSVELDSITASSRLKDWQISERTSNGSGLFRIADMPMYRGDVTLRHADALQATADNPAPCALVNPETIASLSVNDGDNVIVKNGSGSARLTLKASSAIAPDCVHISAGFPETTGLGGHVMVTLEQA